MPSFTLQAQEIPFDDPQSCYRFDPVAKPFVATKGAVDAFGMSPLIRCLMQLQKLAEQHDGLDHLQVFEDLKTGAKLWFIEDGDGGAITALLPEEY